MMSMTCLTRYTIVASFCAATLFASMPANAQSAPAKPVAATGATGKIGFINTERILKDSTLAKAAQQKLESEFSKRDKELQDMAAKIKALNQKLEKDGPVMSDSDRINSQQQLADMNRDFQRKQREFGEDLNAKRNAALAIVLDKANKVVKEIAEKDNYDIIFQDAVYVNPRIDITDKVLKALDAPSK
ncbi:MAG: OmpH/Skp family outer membrane protein [Thiomonas sp.]|uniref:Putative Outer membrane chaperone Skp (OmpH) n=1 Tax=mine drainage metagenome TaxID=410659 RepID=E6PS35_9ZZZZ